ncbi:12421_t:CDS:2, partial [Acaulospora morrowiae]
MAEDYLRYHNTETALSLVYNNISDMLRLFKKSLANDFNIQPPLLRIPISCVEPFNGQEETKQWQEIYSQLNLDQQIIIDKILSSINGQSSDSCFFVDGSGGTEKTFLYQTGIAANFLPNGTTVHSRFKLPLTLLKESTLQLSANSQEAEEIRQAKVIIWDEAPMASCQSLN